MASLSPTVVAPAATPSLPALPVLPATEQALDALLASGQVHTVTLLTPTHALTVAVSPHLGRAVVHELLLATLEQRPDPDNACSC